MSGETLAERLARFRRQENQTTAPAAAAGGGRIGGMGSVLDQIRPREDYIDTPRISMDPGMDAATRALAWGRNRWARPYEETSPGLRRQLDEYAMAEGWTAPVLADPEMGDILRRAVFENWEEETLNSAIMNTQWFANYQSRFGSGGGRRGGGGRSLEQEIDSLVAELWDQSRRMGLDMTREELVDIATVALEMNWNGTQMIDRLLEGVTMDMVGEGDITASVDAMRALAGRYLLPMSDDTLNDMALRMARGELTDEGVRSMFISQAKGRWDWLGSQLDQGITPSDYFAPTKELLARSLELNPNDIDLMDERWMGLLEVVGDDGKTRGATLSEITRIAREQPEWAATTNAQSTMANAAMAVAEAFGRR